jgi:hypothetical protein
MCGQQCANTNTDRGKSEERRHKVTVYLTETQINLLLRAHRIIEALDNVPSESLEAQQLRRQMQYIMENSDARSSCMYGAVVGATAATFGEGAVSTI